LAETLSPPESSPPTAALRELQAAHDIAHAFLTASTPAEVYRLALERVSRLVGAAFGCVFLRSDNVNLLEPVAAFNWPAESVGYLNEMRVRVGNGPTGQAVAERRTVEVSDVFSDPELADWQDAAREMGFASTVAVPLNIEGEPIGAITFYFQQPAELRSSDRSLLRLVAEQLSATAEKAHLIDNLQRANTLLREQNVELEERYREAEEARRLKNEFLANVSHELRTPLTAILGYSYLLREGLSGELGTEQQTAVEKMEAAGTTLMGLINDLLDLTQLKLGRTLVEPDQCDAVALGRAALSTVPVAPAGVVVSADVPDGPVHVHTDPGPVVRILRNLLSNAVKFTPSGRVTLRIRTEAADPDVPGSVQSVTWAVEDTGIGIAEADLDTIFIEFRQADGSATRRYGGTGLGLALSRGLARRLGGDVQVRSTEGEGSVFTLRLPAPPPR
jgi:signal transduction histidine kinase